MSKLKEKKGVLLINLGSPQSPDADSIREFLDEFLMDPLVLDIPFLMRWFLVKRIILPKRPQAIKEKYEKIWDQQGSPLMSHSINLSIGVQKQLSEDYLVLLAMRYGNPSIKTALLEFQKQKIDRVLILPLFPQYAGATTGSVLRKVNKDAKKIKLRSSLKMIKYFYDRSGFSTLWADKLKAAADFKPEHVLFSFHGLPESQIKKADRLRNGCLVNPSCCDLQSEENRLCYRYQSFQTTRNIAEEMGFGPSEYSTAFQSRMGKDKWIEPYTDETISQLAKKGIKRLMVLCPSFVADCLETLEEIQIQESENFRKNGGEKLKLVLSLNSDQNWVDWLSQIIRDEF
ncbi:MAG: ferrochelatase [Deltaproteobacteria bacterium]|nr:ferrochelatase [Deltaproteobacteria bacterium]